VRLGAKSLLLILTYRFEDLPKFDCIVSAANSFGLMDGGIDYAISTFFGWDLQRRVQKVIIEEYLGDSLWGLPLS
jgi:O-acetyl-ADP-ribose deacetylase (regulator of RNase III)